MSSGSGKRNIEESSPQGAPPSTTPAWHPGEPHAHSRAHERLPARSSGRTPATPAAQPKLRPAPQHTASAAAGPSGEPVVRVHGLRYTYPDGTALDYGEATLEIRPRQRTVVLGPNGSGKSTLLLHVLGLLEPQAGEVTVLGRAAHQLRPEERVALAALLQQVDEQLIGPTVWDDVAFAPRNLGLPAAEVDRLVARALRRVGISHLARRVVHALSVGEKQKVAAAGAIVFSDGARFGPKLLVMDEPFAALDPRSRTGLLALIDELRRDHGTAVLLTTHFVHTVPEFADWVCVLAPGGRIAAQGTPAEVFGRPEILEQLDIEPPVLSQLFRSLEQRGISLPPPLSIEHAADLLASHCRPGGRRIPEAATRRRPAD
jgi:cobalt/nickel transport system ATP-binding protein